MIKTVIKHKLAEICINELFRGLFKNFPSMLGEMVTINDLKNNTDKYIGKYITAAYPNKELIEMFDLSWKDTNNLHNAITTLNQMTPIYIKSKNHNGRELKVDFDFNQEGMFTFYEDDMGTVNDLIIFTISNQP